VNAETVRLNGHARGQQRRVMPHNLDAEASVLGGVLLRNEVLALVPNLEVDDFYDFRHKAVWQAMRALQEREVPIDVVTL
jgi:replicative DNA helicase